MSGVTGASSDSTLPHAIASAGDVLAGIRDSGYVSSDGVWTDESGAGLLTDVGALEAARSQDSAPKARQGRLAHLAGGQSHTGDRPLDGVAEPVDPRELPEVLDETPSARDVRTSRLHQGPVGRRTKGGWPKTPAASRRVVPQNKHSRIRSKRAEAFRRAFSHNIRMKAVQVLLSSSRDFMEVADANPAMYIFHVVVIVSSIITYVLETMDDWLGDVDFRIWVTLELVFTFLFTLEIVLRCIAAVKAGRGVWQFLKSPLIWTDIVSTVPFYVLFAWCGALQTQPWSQQCSDDVRTTSVMLALQSIKILRVFKLFRHFSGTLILVRSLERSIPALVPAVLFLVISAACFSAIIFWIENVTAGDEPSHVQNAVDALWFTFITIMTVGYGDTLPLGFTCAIMLYGVLFTAMPLTIIGSEFVDARRKVDKAQEDMRHGAAWSARHAEFHMIPTCINSGNKMAVYHVVADHYIALGTYLDLLDRLLPSYCAGDEELLLDLRVCLQTWITKQVMFLGAISFVTDAENTKIRTIANVMKAIRESAVKPKAAVARIPRLIESYWDVRRSVYSVIERPFQIRFGKILLYLRVLLILISCGSWLMRTVMDPEQDDAETAFAVQAPISAVFLVFLVLGVASAPSPAHHIAALPFWAEVAAQVPFVIGLVLGAESQVVIYCSGLYLARVFSVTKHYPPATVLWEALLESIVSLMIPLFLFAVFTIVFATALYLAETIAQQNGDDDDVLAPTPVVDVLSAGWVIVATMTTVGFGDSYPVSTFGRAVCVLGAVFGTLYTAMPIAIVGTTFHDKFRKFNKSHEFRPASPVMLGPRHIDVMLRYKKAARALAAVLVKIDLAIAAAAADPSTSSSVLAKNRRRMSVGGRVPPPLLKRESMAIFHSLAVIAEEEDGGAGVARTVSAGSDLFGEAKNAAAERGHIPLGRTPSTFRYNHILDEASEAIAELRNMHSSMSLVLDYTMHRLSGMIHVDGGWVREVGHNYRRRVQEAILGVGREFRKADAPAPAWYRAVQSNLLAVPSERVIRLMKAVHVTQAPEAEVRGMSTNNDPREQEDAMGSEVHFGQGTPGSGSGFGSRAGSRYGFGSGSASGAGSSSRGRATGSLPPMVPKP